MESICLYPASLQNNNNIRVKHVKSLLHFVQVTCKLLQFAKFCCNNVPYNWDPPDSIMDYCIGSDYLISEFMEHLKDYWKVRHSGVIGYVQAIDHFLDFRRSLGMQIEFG